MNPIPANTYQNTARAHVLNFIQHLAPTPSEAPYIAYIFAKNSLSMRDFKTLCDFIVSRASESALQSDALDALGLSTLPALRQQSARAGNREVNA